MQEGIFLLGFCTMFSLLQYFCMKIITSVAEVKTKKNNLKWLEYCLMK